YFLKDRLESLRARLVGDEASSDYYDRIWANEVNRRKVTDGFLRLAEVQRGGHFEVVGVVWALMTGYLADRFWWGAEWGGGEGEEWVAREAAKTGFIAIDLLPRLSTVPYRTLQVTAEDNVHPNSLGHRLGAEAFLAWYQASGRAERSGGTLMKVRGN